MKHVFLWLHMIRWKNLLLILLCQFLFKYRVFTFFNTTQNLSDFQFYLLVFSILCIAAGGYIINDVFDIDCDKINKPDKVYIPNKISKKSVKFLYIISTCLGVIYGIMLSVLTGKFHHIFTFLMVVFLLFFYSSSLKKLAFLGNIVIASLIGFTLFILIDFETSFSDTNPGVLLTIQFAYFAFYLNLLREIIKDLEDQKGDYKANMKTLPILLGSKRTINLLLVLSLFPIYPIINFGLRNLDQKLSAKIIYFTFIAFPYFLYLYKLYSSKHKKDFEKISKLLKLILALGLFLLIIITS